MKVKLKRQMKKHSARESGLISVGVGMSTLVHAKKAPASLYTHHIVDGKRVLKDG